MGNFDGMSRKAIAASEAYWQNRGERLAQEREEQEAIMGSLIRRLENDWIDSALVEQYLNVLACKCVAAGKHDLAEKLDECAAGLTSADEVIPGTNSALAGLSIRRAS